MARRGSNKVTVWGYILQMPGRPTQARQRQVLAALGVDVNRMGTLWSDKIAKAKRHRTAGQTQLVGRNDLLVAVHPGDKVIVADPTCLGVSAQDAAWFIEQLAERKVSLTVNGDLHQIAPGDDASEVIGEVARLIRNFNTARSRGRV